MHRHRPSSRPTAALVAIASLAACADPATAPPSPMAVAPRLAVAATSATVAELPTPPASLAKGALAGTTIHVFQEREALTLAAPMALEVATTGTFTTFGTPVATGATLAAGNRVDSYLVHLDPPNPRPNVTLDGAVTFDTDVVGIIVTDGALAGSDATLGAPGTEFPAPVSRRGFLYGEGVPTAPTNDVLTISADRRTVSFQIVVGPTFIDQLRILTCATGMAYVDGQCVAPAVTPESLCALTESYVTKPGVAHALCQKLRSGAYGAYVNQLRAQSGKSLTHEQAATLIAMAGQL